MCGLTPAPQGRWASSGRFLQNSEDFTAALARGGTRFRRLLQLRATRLLHQLPSGPERGRTSPIELDGYAQRMAADDPAPRDIALATTPVCGLVDNGGIALHYFQRKGTEGRCRLGWQPSHRYAHSRSKRQHWDEGNYPWARLRAGHRWATRETQRGRGATGQDGCR